MKKLYTLLFFLFAFGLSYGQEVMVNGGFESWDDASTPTGYSKAENTAQESTEVYSGTYSAKHTGGTKKIAQTVAIEGGKTYTIHSGTKSRLALEMVLMLEFGVIGKLVDQMFQMILQH